MKPVSSLRKIRGAALIIVLAFLVLISIIVVALLQSTLVERGAAHSHLERLRANLLAEMGMDQVASTLRTKTISGDPESLDQSTAPYWITQPGRLVAGKPAAGPGDPADSRLKGVEPIPLSSGLGNPDLGEDYLKPANLNVATFRDPENHLIAETPESEGSTDAVKMYLRWIYVRQDGTKDFSETPDLTNLSNSIVGRYAFWGDDESSKINLNLAWTRADKNEAAPGSPTRVNLTALRTEAVGGAELSEVQADTIHQFVTENDYETIKRLYDSPQSARAVNEEIARILQQNRFEVTHYNSDPDTTFFNEPRIVLTTQKKHSRGLPYLDILTNPGTNTALGNDPGVLSAINYTKVNEVLKLLISYLERGDWPMVSDSAATLQKKYFTNDKTRLAQLAIDIIEYVRSAESTKPFVEPLRIRNSGGTWVEETGATVGAFLGHGRGLLITEMGFWADSAFKNRKVFVEVHLPKHYGLASVDLLNPEPGKKLAVMCQAFHITTYYEVKAENILWGSRILNAGEYRTIMIPDPSPNRSGVTETIDFRCGLTIATPNESGEGWASAPRMIFTPYLVPGTGGDRLTYRLDKTGKSEREIESFQIDDPRVGGIALDWGRQHANTFEGPNHGVSTIGEAANTLIVPEQDTDSQGRISDASLRMPPPRNPADPKTGTVQSVGELGYIPTGAFTRGAGSPATFKGVPWRTLRFQPSKGADNVVPDWAFMDLFTAPVVVPEQAESIFTPHSTAFGGRINVNSDALPFQLERLRPVTAVLKGAVGDNSAPEQTLSQADAEEIARNIRDRVLATGTHKGKIYGREDAYDSPGEVVEIKGVADRGEASEALVHEIANLFTVRGNVFNVYAIGQSLKQTRDGKLLVLSESRQQTILERYTKIINPESAPKVTETRLRVVFSQELNP